MTNEKQLVPQIKYCGLTRVEDVEAACELGVDAIGLNFYSPSPRYVSIDEARQYCHVARGLATRVGVFVDASPSEVAQIVRVCPLDMIQLHGDEPLSWLLEAAAFNELRDLPIIRAISWHGDLDEDNAKQVQSWARHEQVIALLVDAFDPIRRGGTGKTARWDLLTPRPQSFLGKPMLLAGGLKATNIEEAIEMVKPDGVDLASGIESAPGHKDRALMETVLVKARSTFKRLPR